ncbi:MAG: MYXO-CTERM sorting domain-containing protein [Phycisphaerales bacterium JB039]
MTRALIGCAALAVSAGASAQVIDGASFAGEYGPALFAQTVGTGFGDNVDPARDFAGGSEIDGLFGRISGGMLYLGVSGNLETNFNKLDLFFDVAPGGQNKLRGDNPDVDFNGLNRMGDDGSGNGLRFDAGFAADYFVTYTNGIGGSGNPEHYISAAQILTGGGGLGAFVGGGEKSLGRISGAGPLGGAIEIDGDNSNIAGVGPLGDPFVSDPAGVDTGFELAISLTELGWDGSSPIVVAGFINGGGHDFVSNQLLGGLDAGTGNLGEPRAIDLSAIAGAQYVVIPTPGALALGALGLGLMARRRR